MKQIKTFSLAFTYVGCFLGAGFISGQELWQFFGAFGNWGYVGFVLAALLFTVIGILFVRLTQMTQCADVDRLLVPWDIKWLRGASGVIAALFLFFVADVLQAESASGPLLALYFIAGAASLPGWVRLSAKIGRVTAWLAAMVLAMLAFGGAVLLGPGDILPFAVICVASGLALGADLALPAAMAADMGERLRRAGACFGVWNFLGKLSLALAAGLALPLLALFAYQPGTESADGLLALSLVYALLPLGFKLLASVLLWRWRHAIEPGCSRASPLPGVRRVPANADE